MSPKESAPRDTKGGFTSSETPKVETEPKKIRFPKKTATVLGSAALVAGLGFGGYKLFIEGNDGSVEGATTTTTEPSTTTTEGTTTTTTTTTTIPDTTTTTEALQNSEYPGLIVSHDISSEALAFLQDWPKTAEEAAAKFGGDASKWMRNREWPDSRTIDNVNLGIAGYINNEWRPADPENLPFDWPETPEEAAEYFFPGQNIDPRFMMPAWIDPETGLATGWHLAEDHWLFGSEADVTLNIHPGEVAEGYSVNGTLEPEDDRFFVVFGGFRNDPSHDQLTIITTTKGQGWTIWMPGTDPNAIGLRMEQFNGKNNDTPYYQGVNGEQLGPDSYGFTPIYPSPQNNS